MKLFVSSRFLSIAKDLSKEVRNKLMRILYELSNDVRHPGLQTKKIGSSGISVGEIMI